MFAVIVSSSIICDLLCVCECYFVGLSITANTKRLLWNHWICVRLWANTVFAVANFQYDIHFHTITVVIRDSVVCIYPGLASFMMNVCWLMSVYGCLHTLKDLTGWKLLWTEFVNMIYWIAVLLFQWVNVFTICV